METRHFAQVFSAVSSFISDDATRPQLTRVWVPSANRLAATNGHTLCAVDVKEPHGMGVGFYDAKATTRLLKAGVFPADVKPATDADMMFPEYERVLPAWEDKTAKQAGLYNPGYIATAFEAADKLCRAGDGSRMVRLQTPQDGTGPLRIDVSTPHLVAVILVMPMRDLDMRYAADTWKGRP